MIVLKPDVVKKDKSCGLSYWILAGADAVYDAVFQRCGLLRVYDMNELFDTMETLARTQGLWGDRLCITY